MTAFYHGPQTPIVDTGVRPVRSGRVNVVGLIGTAPMHWVESANRSLNDPVLILNRSQARQYFGPARQGYSIPDALDALFDQGDVAIIAVNVLDAFSAPSTETITALTVQFNANGKVQLPWQATLQSVTSTDEVTTYVADTDYAYSSATGILSRINTGAIPAEGSVKVTYSYTEDGDLSTKTDVAKTFPTTGNDVDVIQLEEGLSEVVVTGTGGTPTYVAGTDYILDAAHGTITRKIGGALAAGASVEIDYRYVNPALVQIADLVGAVDGGGKRTGMQAWVDSFNKFGYFPKILIAPGFSSVNAVVSELDVVANQIDAMAVVDAPLGTTYQQVLAGRGPLGTINFNYSSTRLVGCYPYLKKLNPATGAEELQPYSQFLAGVWANKIENRGFWWSPSNTELRGIVGTETRIEFIPGQAVTEANELNAAGIVTYINYFGSGIRTWGNRSFAYPNRTHPDNFINMMFAQLVINERVRLFAIQYIDYPLDDNLIDAIAESINAYLNTLVTQGGLIDGNCVYDPADNPPTELAQGKLKFRLNILPPGPAEWIIFYSYLDISLFETINIGREVAA